MGKVGKAVIVREWNKPVSVEEVTVESPRRGEVMVKIAACGVCRSDLSGANGTIPIQIWISRCRRWLAWGPAS